MRIFVVAYFLRKSNLEEDIFVLYKMKFLSSYNKMTYLLSPEARDKKLTTMRLNLCEQAEWKIYFGDFK